MLHIIKIVLLTIALLLCNMSLMGAPLSGALYMPVLRGGDNIPVYAQADDGGDSEFPVGGDELFRSEDLKSVKTSFLLSLVVPGAGELYAGNMIKAGTFLAIEAGVWTGYFIYQKNGDDGIKEYEAFADAHWDFDFYYDWFASFDEPDIYTEQLPVDTTDTQMHIDTVSGDTTYTYTFEPIKNHDYYEMLGKYDWFVLGWNDFDNRDDVRDSTYLIEQTAAAIIEVLRGGQANAFYRSQWRNDYMTMRKETNDYYDVAKYFIGAALLNHILSAFDAAWTAKRSNDKIYEGFTFNPKLETQVAIDSNGRPVPRLAFNIATF